MDEVISQDGPSVRLRMSERLWHAFAAHRISFGLRTRQEVPVIDILKKARIEQYADFTAGNILYTMGALSYQMTNRAVLSVGRYCSIAEHTSVMGERHPIEHLTTSAFPYRFLKPSFRWARDELLDDPAAMVVPTILTKGDPVLQHDVWIGNQALLQRGITLHTGCVVGAGAVVTKDVPPYAIVGGNPAQILKMRFPEPVIERLLKSCWWDYGPQILFSLGSKNVYTFLDKFEAAKHGLKRFSPETLSWEILLSQLASPGPTWLESRTSQ